jgi:hypothetical protein
MKELRDPHDCVDFIYNNAPAYAEAKGKLAQLEAFKSSLKAILMKESGESSLGAQEREAYASSVYQEHCEALGEATRQSELLKWQIEAARMRFEAWRTESSNQRQFEKMIR